MNIKKTMLSIFTLTGLIACGGGESEPVSSTNKGAGEPQSMYQKAVDPLDNPGVGPIKELALSETIDQELAKKGEELYSLKCTACHKVDKKYIGPSPQGILDRRNPAWVMNMILAPEKMVAEDPIAKKLLMEFNGSPMANQGLTEDEARAILEYFRTI